MESIWPNGMARDRDGSRGGVLLFPSIAAVSDHRKYVVRGLRSNGISSSWTCGNERPHEDKYGRVSFR